MQNIPGFEPFLDKVEEVANSSFAFDAALKYCEKNGWSVEDKLEGSGIDAYIADGLKISWVLFNDPPAFPSAIVYLYWYDPDDPEFETYKQPREVGFDEPYEEAVRLITQKWGKPDRQAVWETQAYDDGSHQFAVWRRGNGVVLLEQAEIDIQFGMDINLWLAPWDDSWLTTFDPPWAGD